VQYQGFLNMSKAVDTQGLMCPSAQQTHIGAQVFGVQLHTASGDVRVGYLPHAYPVTDELLALAGPAAPAEVLRIAAPCIKCEHHDGTNCTLARRVATMLDPAVSSLPRCAIRSTCLWFRQEGKEACLRCPQITTVKRAPTEFEQVLSGLAVGHPEDLAELSGRRAPATDAGA
jgi:hypothetical protein